MAERIRFHLDEHIDPSVARALRRYGANVTTTVETGLRTKSDEEQLAFVRNSGRVLVTRDRHFLGLASQGSHPGIVYCGTVFEIGRIVRGLTLIYEVLTADEIANRVEFI